MYKATELHSILAGQLFVTLCTCMHIHVLILLIIPDITLLWCPFLVLESECP